MEGSSSGVLHVQNSAEMGEKGRKKGSGYKLDVQKKLRISGKEYTSTNVKKPGKKPPVTQKCDYSTQNNYLMGLMEIVPVHWQRHGTCTKPENSQQQSTITYSVCRQTFIDMFAISRSTLQTLATRKKNGEIVFEEKRG
ncbi:hypothetical protein L9F63_002288, partial [Diploptera punctata]